MQYTQFKLTVFPVLDTSDKSKDFLFATLHEATTASESMADLLIFLQDDCKVMNDSANMFLISGLRPSGLWEAIMDPELD